MTIRIKLTESTDARNARLEEQAREDRRAAAMAYNRAVDAKRANADRTQ